MPRSLPQRTVAALLLALVACTSAAGIAPSQRPVPTPATRGAGPTPVALAGDVLPPAYLIWTHDGLPSGLQPKLMALPGVRHAVTVGDDTAWMSRSIDAAGSVVDDPAAPYRIPLETMDASPPALAPFLPPSLRDTVVGALRRGRGVLGASSASVRGLGVGGKLVFEGGVTVTVGAVVPDVVANWSELLVSRRVGRRLGVVRDRFALLQLTGPRSDGSLARAVLPLIPGRPPLRVAAPGKAEFRKNGDSVWPYVLMKLGFGEFAASPDLAHPGYLRMDPRFIHAHLATRTVPVLGAVTCNKVVFPALDAAMLELQRRGLSGLVHSFAGCYSARTVNRVPTLLLSHHSWGAAVDINAPENPFGSKPVQDPRLVAVMRDHGFAWGGLWIVPDGMHFEFRPAGVAAPWPGMP